jgi:hypothetical protein
MLDGLDDVPWHTLEQGYGVASEVPELLRALLSPSEEVRGEAWQELYGNICHQGTIYEATQHAVPFLIELAASRETPDRWKVVSCLGTLADGNSYLDVHKAYREEGAIDQQRLATELGWVQATRTAVVKGEALYLAMLEYPDHMSSAAAAYVLSRFPENAEFYSQPFQKRWARANADPRLRSALAELSVPLAARLPTHRSWLLDTFRNEQHPALRTILAASIATSSSATPDDVQVHLLASLVVDAETSELCDRQPFHAEDAGPFVIKAISATSAGLRGVIERFNTLLDEQGPEAMTTTFYVLANHLAAIKAKAAGKPSWLGVTSSTTVSKLPLPNPEVSTTP